MEGLAAAIWCTTSSFFFPAFLSLSADLSADSTLTPVRSRWAKSMALAHEYLYWELRHSKSMKASTNSFSVIGGSICAASFLHLRANVRKSSFLCIMSFFNEDLSGAKSVLCLYCFRNALARSFQMRISFLSRLRYHLIAGFVRLSWK